MNILQLRQELRSSQAALILSEENRLYFTGFEASNGTLLVTRDGAAFITDSRYFEAAEQTIPDAEVILQDQLYNQIQGLLRRFGSTEILVESSRLTVGELASLRTNLPRYSFNASTRLDTLCNALREVKADTEIECMQKAQDIAEAALKEVLPLIKPGVRERDIANELDYRMRKLGADGISFDTIVVSGENSSKPHGVPGEKEIAFGEFVTIDYGAIYRNYHSDCTRTFSVGQPSEKMVNVYETVRRAQQAGLDSIRPGMRAADLDKAARGVIDAAGYGEYFGHSTGHGVGVEIHETPYAGPKSEDILAEHTVVTCEPGIYLPGQFGVRIEDMVLVTADGHRNFAHLPKELIVL